MTVGETQTLQAHLREEIELLRDQVIHDRILLPGKNAKLLFLPHSCEHPYPGKIWTQGIPDFALLEQAGTPPYWGEPLGKWSMRIRCRTEDDSDLASYDVFLAGYDRAIKRFWQIASAAGELLLADAEIPTSDFVKELFEFSRLQKRLTWEFNEQPGHPETKRRIAWLYDVYQTFVSFLNARLESLSSANPNREAGGQRGKARYRKTIGKRRGKPNVTPDEAKIRQTWVAKWQRWKTANPGRTMKCFYDDETALDRPIDPPTLTRYVNWVTQNRTRKAQKRG